MFNRRKSGYLLVAIVLALSVMRTAAAHYPPPTVRAQFDGHYYEVIFANKITWDAAKAAAEQLSFQGIQGHLATIDTLAEDQFVHQLRQQALSAPNRPKITGTELWVGGEQFPCTPEPGCGWNWINGRAISPVNTDSPYTHWLPGEPNNLTKKASADNLPSERHLAIGLDGKFGWNDEGYLPNMWGYVVEYGDKVTVPASTCTSDGPGCNPSGAQVVQFPPGAQLSEGATLSAKTYLIHDDPARCGNQTLSLFNGAVVIPPYLCGHPDFIVIETATTGVEILAGAVDVENLTEEVLPDNLYGCTSLRQNPSGENDPDPSHRDVVAWQTTDPQGMLETSSGTGRFFGTVAEVTYGCGSSRGKVVNGSYHFVGLRIHPGDGNEFSDGNPQGNHQSFVDLTGYKLQLLRASVEQSKAALSKFSYLLLKFQVDSAIYFHNCGKYKLALAYIKLFGHLVEHTKYKVIAGENFSGDHIMRGSNLEFVYAQKVIPFGSW